MLEFVLVFIIYIIIMIYYHYYIFYSRNITKMLDFFFTNRRPSY